jgi:uncharacterized protein (TIGR03083 family)
VDGAPVDLAAEYRTSRQRLSALLADLPPERWDVAVDACPGWSVRGVVSHLLGTVEDALAGRITGPPPEEITAEQVARHAGADGPELLARWAEIAPPFEEVVATGGIWPAVLDVVSHEHDVRTALALPGARDAPVLAAAAAGLVEGVEAPWVIEVELPDGRVVRSAGDGPVHRVRTTPFELVRIRLGRRSPDQVRALAWEPGPPDDLAPLFRHRVFLRRSDQSADAAELAPQVGTGPALAAAHGDGALESLQGPQHAGAVGVPAPAPALLEPLRRGRVPPGRVAAAAGDDLVLDPRRPALEPGDKVLGRGCDEARVDLAPAPDAAGAVAHEDAPPSFGAVRGGGVARGHLGPGCHGGVGTGRASSVRGLCRGTGARPTTAGPPARGWERCDESGSRQRPRRRAC